MDKDENLSYIIKVGFTEENLERRLMDYKTHNPSVKLLGTFEQGTQLHEAMFHSIFKDKHLKIKGSREWFIFDQSIIDFFLTMTSDSLEALYKLADEKKNKREVLCESILDDVVDQKLRDIIMDYFKLTNIDSQIKYICEIGDVDVLEEFLILLPEDEYAKQYYLLLGKDKCKALCYNVTSIRKFINVKTFEFSDINDQIYKVFKEGERYTKAFIKDTLKQIYEDVKYKGAAKASDLEKWFEIKSCLITENGKRVNAFEIIKKK